MVQHNSSPGSASERKQLLILAAGLALISAGLWWYGPGIGLAWLPAAFAVLALTGAIAHAEVRRNVYLLFAMAAFLIGACVSWLALRVAYMLAIAGFGSVLKAFGMDMLKKRFRDTKGRSSMFDDAPVSDKDSFRRQS